jgi:hypothetical protein
MKNILTTILDKIRAPFRWLFARTKNVAPEFRRLTKAEAAIQGVSYSAKRMVPVTIKKVTKRTKTFSNRQVAELKAGKKKEKITREYAPYRRVTGITNKDIKIIMKWHKDKKSISSEDWKNLWRRYSRDELLEALGSDPTQ